MAPDYIFYRDPMWLNCSMIDLDYNQIYSIKWFKDNQEMYRFITADELTPRTFYDTTGIVIDVSILILLFRSYCCCLILTKIVYSLFL